MLAEVLALFSPGQAVALTFLGAVMGYFLFGRRRWMPPSVAWFFIFLLGLGFFVFATVFRAFLNVTDWERTIGTGLLWPFYAAGVFIGLHIWERRALR